MKYYSEDDVMELIREAEDCERAYEWGEGHRSIHFEDYHPIEIPDKHGRLIDEAELVRIADEICHNPLGAILEDVSTIVEATE